MIVCHPEDYEWVFNELDDIVRGEFYTITKTWVCPEGFNPETSAKPSMRLRWTVSGGL